MANKKHVIFTPGPWPGAWVMGKEEIKAVEEVLKAKSPFRHYGPSCCGKVFAFEKKLREYIGTKYALGLTSGTASLKVSLVAIDMQENDEVIMPAYTWIACPSVVFLLGGTPVLCEVDKSLTIDAADVEKKITKKTKAIMVVHPMGISADMGAIKNVAKKHGVYVIEDCAQSIGASFNGNKTGSIGDIGAFSFQMNKIITSGDGGAITTSDFDLYERAIRYHDLGFVRESFEIKPKGAPFFGENYRMNELSGAVLLDQIKKLDSKIISPLRKIKMRIKAEAGKIKNIEFRSIPDEEGDASTHLVFFVENSKRAVSVLSQLKERGIRAGQPYEGKTLYEGWREWFETVKGGKRYGMGLCPKTEDLLRRTISIPLVPILKEGETKKIIEGIKTALTKTNK